MIHKAKFCPNCGARGTEENGICVECGYVYTPYAQPTATNVNPPPTGAEAVSGTDQMRLHLSPHGLLGALGILVIILGGLLGEWYTYWQWWATLLVMFVYTPLVIHFVREDDRLPEFSLQLWLVGLHCSLIIFSLGIWSELPTAGLVSALVLCLPLGLVLPRLLFSGRKRQWRVTWNGLFGLFGILVMLSIALVNEWDVPWGYLTMSLLVYSSGMMAFLLESGPRVGGSRYFLYCVVEFPPILLRLIWGMHIALLFSSAGMLTGMQAAARSSVHVADSLLLYSALFFFSFFAGLAIPFVLFRRH